MKNDRGVTLVALTATIIVILILIGVVVYQVNIRSIRSYDKKIQADINQLSDQLLIYYHKTKDIPKTHRQIMLYNYKGTSQTDSDGKMFYEIDLDKLSDLTLNFGKEFRWNQ